MKRGTMRIGTIGAMIAAGCALAIGSGTALAESACKGLPQGACEKAADCIWVGAYERKDGKQVSGYCRSKGGSGAEDEHKGAKETGAKAPAKHKAQEAPATTGRATPAMPKTPDAPAATKTPKPIEMPSMPRTRTLPADSKAQPAAPAR
jgi:hypothetical protein